MIGGRVLPAWPAPPPAWLTHEHWGPLALVDYGDRSIRVDSDNPLCLVGANLAVRRSLFDAVGVFAPDVQRVKDSMGSSEDHEFLLRVFRAGRFGVYDPGIVIHAAVQPDRLERAYHRRWHDGHGHFHALMRPEYLEASSAGRVFDVPAHMYRSAVRDAAGWAAAMLGRDAAGAFSREVRLRFFRGTSGHAGGSSWRCRATSGAGTGAIWCGDCSVGGQRRPEPPGARLECSRERAGSRLARRDRCHSRARPPGVALS